MPGQVPAEDVYAGDTWSRSFTITQSGTAVNLPAVGWTGWAAQWRPSAGSAAVQTIAVDDSNAASGVLALSLTGAQTEQMAGDGVWDLQGQLDTATITILAGSMSWTQDVTR